MKPDLSDKNIITSLINKNNMIKKTINNDTNNIFFNFFVILLFIIFILFLIFRYLEKKKNIL